MMVKCKICDVKDLHVARLVASLGADFIGLHAIHGLKDSRRPVFSAISREFRTWYPRIGVVLVTKVVDQDAIVEMVSAVEPTHLQLHARWSSGEVAELRTRLSSSGFPAVKLILMVDPSKPEFDKMIADLRPVEGRERYGADYFIFDHEEGGTGLTLDPEHLRPAVEQAAPVPVFLAGGLTPENVTELVRAFKPYAVDVQSGVERPKGTKDPRLIRDFISAAKGMRRATFGLGLSLHRDYPAVSLALAACPEDKRGSVLTAFAKTDLDLVHLDYSDDRTQARSSQADLTPALEALRECTPYLPYDLHILSRGTGPVDIALRCLAVNPLLRAVHLRLGSPSDPENGWVQQAAEGLAAAGVGVVLALDAPATEAKLSHALSVIREVGPEEVSVVGPSRASDLQAYESAVRPVFTALQRLRWTMPRPFALCVDRAMNAERTEIAGRLGARKVVSGTWLLRQDDAQAAQAAVSRLRQLLEPDVAADPEYLAAEDIVAKLRFVRELEAAEPYRVASDVPCSSLLYDRIRDALESIPPHLRAAALTVYANTVYLSDTVLNHAWCYLWNEAAVRLGWDLSDRDLPRRIKFLEVDPDGMAAQFARLNKIAGRLDERPRGVDGLDHLLDLLVKLRSPNVSEDDKSDIQALFGKEYWVILVDNSLSGTSLKAELLRYARIYELLRDDVARYPRMVVLIQVLTSVAREAVEATLSADRRKLFDIIPALYFDGRFRITEKGSGLTRLDSTPRAIAELCHWFVRTYLNHDRDLDRLRRNSGDDLAFGFRGGGWTIVTQQNCPSNTLPLLWYASPPPTLFGPQRKSYVGPFVRTHSRVSAEQPSPIKRKMELLLSEGEGLTRLHRRLREVMAGGS